MKNYFIITFLLFFVYFSQAQIVEIPDPYFKAYLIDNFDTNNDGEIQVSEAEVVTNISPAIQEPITSLEGIQSFTSLEWLSVRKNFNSPSVITEVDLSNNIYLSHLNLHRNGLEFIDLNNNINLIKLILSGNPLISIDLSNNINLEFLDLVNMVEDGGPGLNSLDLSNNFNLKEVNLANSNLSFLNIQNGNNQSLEDLNIQLNPLLSCVLVDDEDYEYPECVFAGDHMDGWCIDGTTILSEDCSLNVFDINTEQLKIYPNPSNDNLNIISKEPINSIKIYSINGSLIIQQMTEFDSLDISKLKSGVYLVQIGISDKHIFKKLIKE